MQRFVCISSLVIGTVFPGSPGLVEGHIGHADFAHAAEPLHSAVRAGYLLG